MILSRPSDLNMRTVVPKFQFPVLFMGHFDALGVPRRTLKSWGFPGRRAVILHCTLLLKTAGQEKFAPTGA